jgi:hypothetical protein
VSLSDIIQFVGTGSVPVLVAATVYGVFELGEKLTSQRAKDALSRWLVSFDVRKAKTLPDGTLEIFQRIFGDRHFSLRCFIRSAAFSLGAMVFIGIIAFLIDPNKAFEALIKPYSPHSYGDLLLMVRLWLPWSILIDYVSLFKTRIILQAFTRMRRSTIMMSTAILAGDLVAYHLLYSLGLLFMWFAILGVNHAWTDISEGWFGMVIWTIKELPMRITYLPTFGDKLYLIFFWGGFAPSIWMWLYVLALFVTRALLRSEKLVNWLRWFLDIEKTPFRSIGAVAAILAFVASAAIILISAEVSRISAAA